MKLLEGYFGTSLAGGVKAVQWYESPNPLLGNISPKHMVHAGKADKVIKFIKQQLGEDSEKAE